MLINILGIGLITLHTMMLSSLSSSFLVLSRSVLLVEETGVPGEKHTPGASHCQRLTRNDVSSTHRRKWDSKSQL